LGTKSITWDTWDESPQDIIADLKAAKEIIAKHTGVGRPMSFREALYWDVQGLWAMGCSAREVELYIEFMLRMLRGE
jgi:hypothetical protein